MRFSYRNRRVAGALSLCLALLLGTALTPRAGGKQPPAASPVSPQVYGPSNVQTPALFGPEKFTREAGAPQAVNRTFTVTDWRGEFTLVIRNGEDGAGGVSSAVVELNGFQVAGPADFNQQTGQVVKLVSLNQTNALSVELRGSPGSSVTISVEAGAPSSVFPRFTLYTNRTDPQLLRAETVDGGLVDYFGEKDANGFATSVKVIRTQDAPGRVNTFELDEQGRPSLFHSFNGTVFKIAYLSDTSVIVTVTSEGGLIDLDVPVSLTGQTAGQISALQAATRVAAPGTQTFTSAAATFAQPTSTITVKNCGVPVNNAAVNMQVKTSSGINFTLPGYPTGDGVYQIPIPTPDRTALQRVRQKCLRVARVLDLACEGIGRLFVPLASAVCPAIAVAIAATGVGAPVAVAVLASCEAFVTGFELYCGLGGPQVSEILCDRIYRAIDRVSNGPVTLIPTVKIPGQEARSNLSIAPPDGPFPPFSFNFPCGCQSGLGSRFITAGGNVSIRILPFEADFTDEIRLLVRGQSRTLATNRDVGRTIDLGRFAPGTELIFYIHVRDTGLDFFTGPGSRNRDGLTHARVECLGGGRANIYFEDNLGGGDRDFDDAVFQVTTTP